MKTITKTARYQTNEGCEFEDEASAKRHEAICDAKAAYENAKHLLSKLLAESCKTADSHQFEFGMWHEYCWIRRMYDRLPELVKVSFWGRNWEINCEAVEGDSVVISELNDCHGSRVGYIRSFPIHELYRDNAKAQEALIAAQRVWLAERLRELSAR